MKCVVCSSDTRLLFEQEVLQKYLVSYFRCDTCGLMQTEKPYWLDEAYQDAITSTDIGLLSRNLGLSKIVFELVSGNFDTSGKYLDYGGGYGILVRLLRDRGLDFYRQDPYCKNIFAVHHDLSDLGEGSRNFELLTCFEVFEHSPAPLRLFEELLACSDNVFISTVLIPNYSESDLQNWWYLVPDTGQHVTFYSLSALKLIAKQFNMNLYSNGDNLHLFTRKKLKKDPFDQNRTIKHRLIQKIITSLNGPQTTPLRNLVEGDLELARRRNRLPGKK